MSATDSLFIKAIAEQVAKMVLAEIRPQLEKPMAVQKVLYDLNEASIMLGCSRRALETIILEREIAVIRRGRRVHIHKRDIDEFIEKNRV